MKVISLDCTLFPVLIDAQQTTLIKLGHPQIISLSVKCSGYMVLCCYNRL